MTHWFLSFLYKRRGEDRWQPQDATTEGEHPLDYIARARAAYDEYEYRLLYFHVIPEDVFRRVHPAVTGAIPQTMR